MACSICLSADVSKINQAIREGATWRSVAVTFSASRSAVQRHCKHCLGLNQHSASEEARHLLKAKHARLDGKLSEALVTAEKLRVLASERMDTKLMLQAQKEIGRLLAMQQRANGKVPREVSITEHARIDIAKAHWSVSFPEGTEQEFVDRFGMKERTDLPDTAPRIVWKVNWLDAEIQNPESLLPITATPSEVEEAENRKEEQ